MAGKKVRLAMKRRRREKQTADKGDSPVPAVVCKGFIQVRPRGLEPPRPKTVTSPSS